MFERVSLLDQQVPPGYVQEKYQTSVVLVILDNWQLCSCGISF